MASSMLDIQPNIQAVSIPRDQQQIHRIPRVNIDGDEKLCRCGIVLEYINNLLLKGQRKQHKSFLGSLPGPCLNFKAHSIQQQIKDFRVYSGLAQDELHKLDTCKLVDEFKANLKSMEDYLKAINHTFSNCNMLNSFKSKHILPMPGDWPTWFYSKKITAQSQDGTYNSIIPEQGAFHVGLNIIEDVIIFFYHFFFNNIYKQVFGSELPLKPEPFRSNFVITATMCAWLLI
ncbi:uncharacterized protein LOC125559089 [Nematostella vectensis]|uniref:uncharacterized protein LOC125559089 n=1 Tax=Nematostella vectensis TaxID=45351 RepID=UPI0020774C0D|nr:uncharacterized protein LOC125559089 [Nematostella vectensis]